MAGRLNMAAGRLNKELKDLECKPPEGVICYPVNDSMVQLHAELEGPEDTPYFGGVFQIEINIPERYPMEPPRCQFITKVYHPNIDDQGRICLDILKTGSKGTWRPSLNIQTVLTSLRVLLAYPNPDDPLIVDIANEFKENQEGFTIKAKDYTRKYAVRRIENSSSAYEMKDGASLTEKESGRTKLLAEHPPSLSSSLSSSSTSTTSNVPSTSPSIRTPTISTPTPEPLSNLFGLGLGSSISGPGRQLLAKRPALKKPNLSMRKPTTPSPNATLSEPVIATEVVDADGTVSAPNTSCHHDQQPGHPQVPTQLSYTNEVVKAPAEVVQDISRQEDSPSTIPQARPMSKKRPSGSMASTPSLKKSNKKARAALEIAKVQDKGEEGTSPNMELTDLHMLIDSNCLNTGRKGVEDHAVLSHDTSSIVLGHGSLLSNSTQPDNLPIEVQSRFFVNVSETIVETTADSELEPVPTQPPVTEPEPVLEFTVESTLDVVAATGNHLPSASEADPVPEPSCPGVPILASESKSEALYGPIHEPILEQGQVPEPKVELGPVQDDTRSSSEPLEPATEAKPRIDKGKGRAIELVEEEEEVVRKDFTRIPVMETGMVRKTYVVPLSERQTNVPTSLVVPSAPLTVARKRDLLKKRPPLPVERKVE